VVEHTPNPDAIKLLLGRTVALACAEFEDAGRAREASPLAADLLLIAGLRRVYIGPDFVVLTKSREADWRALAPLAQRRVSDALARGESLLRVPPEPPVPHGDLAELVRAEAALQELAPLVASHGGELELVGYRDGVLELRLRGACRGCPSSELTLRALLESRLRAALPGLRALVAS
jgi:Fe-S cluster biogenesis protein NfuA